MMRIPVPGNLFMFACKSSLLLDIRVFIYMILKSQIKISNKAPESEKNTKFAVIFSVLREFAGAATMELTGDGRNWSCR
jgi:L-asparagine transporter-like permease